MLSVSPSSVSRSQLEEMLEALQRRTGYGKPKDLPPELPARPKSAPRARPPSVKRTLPRSLETADVELSSSWNCNSKKANVRDFRGNSFGAKKAKEMELSESPYGMPPQGNDHKRMLERRAGLKLANSSPGLLPKSREVEWADTIDYFIKEKLRIWCREQNGQWELGTIHSTTGEIASVLFSDGKVVKVPTGEILPANPDILDGVDDLIQLSYLNEPSVLHNFQHRYSCGAIYSKAGPLLIAVNPLRDVDMYGNEFVTAYQQKQMSSPHVFSIVDTAYTAMMEDGKNHSVIISGETGSGKTETAKIAIQYLAALGEVSNEIESKLQQTSCILEAFGNAKTHGNYNSSRFGKLIEIHFNTTGKLCGAKVQTFLLEKSRVVQLPQGERSYHIFYQLCAGAPSGLKDKLKIKGATEYNYLIQSDCLVLNGVDDAKKFHMLMEALNTVKICKEDQERVFQMLSAVLWLGNISFEVIDNENHVEAVSGEAITNAASLIGCSAQDLICALSSRRVQAGQEKVAQRLTMQQAIDTRDALAKFIYGSLFDWLVDEINKSLAVGKHHTYTSINILDIYGFESFKNNGFEQFCINYSNERLQQHFNRHLFKLEQEVYELDGIDWTRVEFKDNQECLDLFEKKHIGLISLLDEESNSLEANDLSFANKLKQQLKENCCFKEREGTFSIQHYAGEVLYDNSGFLEKNRDVLHSDIIQLLSSCCSLLPQLFATSLLDQSQKLSPILLDGLYPQKQSVATKFKVQLFKLMRQLDNTAPHFICCIKPNNKQLPGVFEKALVLQQLRYVGVFEAVRISRYGYPTKMTHQCFSDRYGFLLDNNVSRDPLSTAVAVLQQFNVLPELYQVGYTKLYLRAGQIAALEDARKQVLEDTVELQKFFHDHRAGCDFHEIIRGVVMLQSFVRGEIARRQCNALVNPKVLVACKNNDEQLMATRIQSAIRGFLARRHIYSQQNSQTLISEKQETGRKILELKDLPSERLPSVVEELQKRVLIAEATIEQNEKENAELKEQVKQFEARCSEYEAKMSSMEEGWRKKMSSLQASVAAAKNLGSDNAAVSPPPYYYDSEDIMSLGLQTSGASTPLKFPNNGVNLESNREINGGVGAINHLVREFEQRKHYFDSEATAICEVKAGQSLPSNPEEELKRLVLRFENWKKCYKGQLSEAKAKVRKLRHSVANSSSSRRTWWGLKTKRVQL